MREEIERMVRRLHHYGDPPDSRLQEDVDADVGNIMEAVDTLTAAARRAGAEEMRERCAKAAQKAPDTWTSLSDLRWQQSIAYKCAAAIRALHPDAKGGERA